MNTKTTLLVTWASVMALMAIQDVLKNKDLPCPGRMLRASALYIILGVLSEFEDRLAVTLGIGFAIALMYNAAVAGGGKTFFGVKVG